MWVRVYLASQGLCLHTQVEGHYAGVEAEELVRCRSRLSHLFRIEVHLGELVAKLVKTFGSNVAHAAETCRPINGLTVEELQYPFL